MRSADELPPPKPKPRTVSRRGSPRTYLALAPRGRYARLGKPNPEAAALRRLLLDAAMIRHGLTAELETRELPSYDVVRVLWALDERNGPQEVSKIARALGLARSSASRLLDRAEAAGLVDKVYADFDRRVTEVRVSIAGRGVLADADEALIVAVATARSPRPARARTHVRWARRTWHDLAPG